MISQDDPNTVKFVASPTVKAFMATPEPYRLIVGPFGSGKSSGCVIEMLRWAMNQAPGPDGYRRTRFAIIRNSYREIKDTAQRTVEDWIPAKMFRFVAQDATMFLEFNDVRCEILYRALDTPQDVKKLLSLDLTGAWINEAREIPKQVFEMLKPRVGRFPSQRAGGPTKHGIWMDTNPPDSDHWIYKLFEEQRPAKHAVFHQPSGLSPEAENIENLPGGRDYYLNIMPGMEQTWIDVYVHGQYGYVKDGRPVYPEWKDALHVMKLHPTLPVRPTLILGMDFGLTPAIVVVHKTLMQYQVIDEFVSEDMGANRLSQHVARELRRKYPTATFRGWGDPAGTQRSQVDETTPYDVVQAAGLPIYPAPTNDFVRRREGVAGALGRLNLAGEPALVVSPNCSRTRKAMGGGYSFKRVQVSGEERYQDAPNKNSHSHIAEALQYAMVGEGEDNTAMSVGGVDEHDASKYKVVSNLAPRRSR